MALHFSTATGCGSLWPFTSSSSADPPPAQVQADKTKPTADKADPPADKAKQAEPEKAIVEDEKPGRWHFLTPWKWEMFHPKAPPGEAETLVLRGDHLEPEKMPDAKKRPTKAVAELSGAHELYRLGDYEKAEKIFFRIADDSSHTPPAIAEEARFYQAECLRRLQHYPRACDTYHKLLLDSKNGAYKEQAIQRIFDIANFWLEDTRGNRGQQGREGRQRGAQGTATASRRHSDPADQDGKEPKSRVSILGIGHLEPTKPMFDEEGRALEALEWVRFGDIMGPLADQCLFLSGSVKFYREDYRSADDYFTQLAEMHPNSKYAPTAVELSIVSKHMSTGGSDYDGRKVAEARQMIDRALRNYPTLANQKKEFLIRQLAACTMQQAEKDYKIAEFYRRTGHPGSAYFYYEIVRRRYPGTPFSDKATERMLALRQDIEKEQKEASAAPERANRETAPAPRALTPGMPLEEVAPAPQRGPAGNGTAAQETAVEHGTMSPGLGNA